MLFQIDARYMKKKETICSVIEYTLRFAVCYLQPIASWRYSSSHKRSMVHKSADY